MTLPDETPTIIRIRGIRASGRHGANPGEQSEAQEFIVDVDVQVTPGGDSLTATADYREIVETVGRAVAGTSFTLLETIARHVAESLLAFELVDSVTVVVHKPAAAASLHVADVSATATTGA